MEFMGNFEKSVDKTDKIIYTDIDRMRGLSGCVLTGILRKRQRGIFRKGLVGAILLREAKSGR